MAIPDYQTFMLPLLESAATETESSLAGLRQHIATKLNLSPEDLSERLPSGQMTVFVNRVAWAKVYLERAELIEKTRRGYFCVTERGREVLAKRPERIDVRFLKQFPEFNEFLRPSKSEPAKTQESESNVQETQTPTESLQSAINKINDALAAELLRIVSSASPRFFEQLVIDVLLKLGYGGSREEAGSLTSAGADEGIDGIINEDRLGLSTIYIQAKRWSGTVGRPEIQKFVGALHGQRARKGVFLTTSSFSADAVSYADSIDPRVILIDGRKLVRLMIEFNVGISSVAAFELKRIDTDYFEESGLEL